MGIKSKSSYDLKNPNFRYMSTPPSVPGTLHANPTDSYFHDVAATTTTSPSSTTPYITNSHVAPSPSVSSQFSSSHAAPNVAATTSTPHQANSSPAQSILGPAPTLNLSASATPTSTLNPSAPQFVPLPDSVRMPSSSGILTTPSAGGYFQSNALYMMGSQQMVYSQCPANIGVTSTCQGTNFTSNGGDQTHSVVDVHQTRHSPYGVRSQYY